MHELIPLSHLNAGATAEVAQVVGLPEQVRRIHEMGLRDGTRIEMVRCGAPCIVRIGGQTLCFRANELLNVLVRPGAAT